MQYLSLFYSVIDFNRMIPTEAEMRTSLNRWDRGICTSWAQDDPEVTFPVVEWKHVEGKEFDHKVCLIDILHEI